MIVDSGPWRVELAKSALRLQKWDVQRRWTSRTYFLAEKDIMMGAYSIRRLIESQKCSSRLPGKGHRVVRYPVLGRTPMTLDRFNPERFYDLDAPISDQLNLARLCNQVVHSYIFQIYETDDRTTSLLFASDYDRSKYVYSIGLSSLAAIFDYVAREEVLQVDGTVIDGEQRIVNTSNHDLVEDGKATYSDQDRVSVTRSDENEPVSAALLRAWSNKGQDPDRESSATELVREIVRLMESR